MQAQPILPSCLPGMQFEADIEVVSHHILMARVEEFSSLISLLIKDSVEIDPPTQITLSKPIFQNSFLS